jgi:hypothetical protein
LSIPNVLPILGVIVEDMSVLPERTRTIILPLLETSSDTQEPPVLPVLPVLPDACDCISTGSRITTPTPVSETELANNPDVYNEDPGSYCKPFERPERILSEKVVFSIMRSEQPIISSDISTNTRNVFEVDEKLVGSIFGKPTSPIFVDTDQWSVPWYDKDLANIDHGRRSMNASYPAQWESDSFRYQASTVSRGHILEFRITTRSNGYSRGSVANSIPLAPRQAKRKSNR